jgi:hypothetical protein
LAFADASRVGPEHIDEAAKDLRLTPEKPTAQAPRPEVAGPKTVAAAPETPPAGVRPIKLRTIEQNGARQSFFGRWASKLGLA